MQFLREETQDSDVATREAATQVLTKLQHASWLLKSETGKEWGLETILTHLELYGNIGNLKVLHGNWTPIDKMKVVRTVANAFQWYQYKLHRVVWDELPNTFALKSDPALIRNVCPAWAELIASGDTLITFNWDLLHEAILWRAGKWSYSDGYGFRLNKLSCEEASQIRIYKLHGSVNWVQDEGENDVEEIEHLRDFFPGSENLPRTFPPKTAAWDSGRKLVLPTFLKDISSNRALLEVWRQAQDALRQATEICVVGYSLNPADHPARLLIGTELRRNSVVKHVKVVSTSVGGWADFLGKVGKKMDWVKQRFEDWVSAQPPH